MATGERPPLRLIRGGRAPVRVGRTRVTVGTGDGGAGCDAVVREEDTWLILSAAPEVTPPAEPLTRIMTELLTAQPHPPGTVLVREGHPLVLLAVVHDFDEEPCCRLDWVRTALTRVLDVCRERRIGSVSLPLLGVTHGRLTPQEALTAIVSTLREWGETCPRDVTLSVPGDEDAVRRLLESAAATPEED